MLWRRLSIPEKRGLSARSRRRDISAPMTVRPRDTSRCAACACCVRVTGPTVKLDWSRGVKKSCGFSGANFICRSRPRPVPETLACQPVSASSARSNYDQAILVETSEKRWRVTQGWHPEEGVRGTAENHKRFGVIAVRCRDASCLLSLSLSLSPGVPFFSDINELNLPKTCGTEFPDPDDLLSFKLIICPDEVSRRSFGAPYGPYGRSGQCHSCPVGNLKRFQYRQSIAAPINTDSDLVCFTVIWKFINCFRDFTKVVGLFLVLKSGPITHTSHLR